ncbi:MAG: hypothetical protein B6240_00570 [Desulfobacteraceae bacterium 4572_87]|nr:MAG: hypothetical protein B6240_00570 [Desulfobacteraceae bacterium 4572_87]
MSNEQDQYPDGKIGPKINLDPEPDSDGIIELTDVVSEGSAPLEPNAEAPLLLDEEKPDDHQAELTDDAAFGDVDSLSGDLEKAEDIMDPVSEDPFSALESSDFKFENSPAFEAADTESFPEPSEEHLDDFLVDLETETSEFEKPEDILADLEKDEPENQEISMEQPDEFLAAYESLDADESLDKDEKPEDVLACLEEKDKEVEKPVHAATPDIPGISEERMKALLTEVIQETVDKAVRETVSEVAEKVIREAIEGLKQSIASSENE